ncbi:minor tail protein [Erwinia phage AH03]|uniref:Minor tail protein n=1 Tax=Erwinia phage AH03 TaxID=2869568 RepID=A0AAE7X0C6_9CAUD|nr:minor tail protein [Erwinia phage AH03]
MDKISIPPDQSGYTVANGTGVKSTLLDGGLGRYRLDILNASSTVSCAWTVNRSEYDYLMAFFRVNEKNGGAAFLIDLILDTHLPEERTARLIPASWGLTQQAGTGYTVGCQLEVEAIPSDEDYDQSLVDVIGAYDSAEKAIIIMNLLHKLVHYDLPVE